MEFVRPNHLLVKPGIIVGGTWISSRELFAARVYKYMRYTYDLSIHLVIGDTRKTIGRGLTVFGVETQKSLFVVQCGGDGDTRLQLQPMAYKGTSPSIFSPTKQRETKSKGKHN